MMLDRERAESPPDRIVFGIGRYAESLVVCQWTRYIPHARAFVKPYSPLRLHRRALNESILKQA